MTEDRKSDLPAPDSAPCLRTVSAEIHWIRRLGMIGALLIAAIVALTLFAPSALWFLLYPLLILGALGTLAMAVVLLLRFF